MVPILLLAVLNLRILLVYRRSCERRRRMTISRTTSGEEDPRKFAEERRLMLLLGSTSILFLVCVSPMVILNVTLTDANLALYPYQVMQSPQFVMSPTLVILMLRRSKDPNKGRLHRQYIQETVDWNPTSVFCKEFSKNINKKTHALLD